MGTQRDIAFTSTIPGRTVFAAGVFSIARIRGEYFVLFGQRGGDDIDPTAQLTWCNLGGRVEASQGSPSETAATEAREESNEVLRYHPASLEHLPFVDFPIPGTMQDYRLFIAPTQYQPASLMTEHLGATEEHSHKEYEQFRWIKLKDLMTLMADIKDQDIVTIEALQEGQMFSSSPSYKAAPTEKIKIRIYQPMKMLLQQENFQETLSAMMAPFAAPGDWERKISTLHPVASDIAETMLQKMKFMEELCLITAEKNKKQAASMATPSVEEGARPSVTTPTHSEKHLDRVLALTFGPDTVKTLPLKEKIDMFLDHIGIGGERLYDQDLRRQLAAAIHNEAVYERAGYMTFYHSVPREVTILYDLYTAVYQKLRLTLHSEDTRFRWSERPWREWPTLEAFIAHFTRKGGGSINNYTAGFQEAALSANYFAFGNYAQSASATYYLYAINEAASRVNLFSAGGIFQGMLASTGMDHSRIRLLLQRADRLLQETEKSGATLYQIHIPEQVVAACVYPANAVGVEFTINNQKKTLHELVTNYMDNAVVLQELQVRILMLPESMKAARYTAYPHHALPAEQETRYLAAVQEIADSVFRDILIEQGTEGVFLEPPMASKLFEDRFMEATGKRREYNPIEEFKRVYQKPIDLERFLNKNPDFFVSPGAIDNLVVLRNKYGVSHDCLILLLAKLPMDCLDPVMGKVLRKNITNLDAVMKIFFSIELQRFDFVFNCIDIENIFSHEKRFLNEFYEAMFELCAKVVYGHKLTN